MQYVESVIEEKMPRPRCLRHESKVPRSIEENIDIITYVIHKRGVIVVQLRPNCGEMNMFKPIKWICAQYGINSIFSLWLPNRHFERYHNSQYFHFLAMCINKTT